MCVFGLLFAPFFALASTMNQSTDAEAFLNKLVVFLYRLDRAQCHHCFAHASCVEYGVRSALELSFLPLGKNHVIHA